MIKNGQQILFLLMVIVCGVNVYMAMQIRKKLQRADDVMDNVSQCAASIITKDDMKKLQTAMSSPSPHVRSDVDNPPHATGDVTPRPPLSMTEEDEPVVVAMPKRGKRARTAENA